MADSPDWTDWNESDPGITLLEVFGFLAVGYLFMTSRGSLLERMGLVKRVVIVQVDGKPWSQVETLEDAGPDASVFRVDPASGSVQFGDGTRGRIPSGAVRRWLRSSSGTGHPCRARRRAAIDGDTSTQDMRAIVSIAGDKKRLESHVSLAWSAFWSATEAK